MSNNNGFRLSRRNMLKASGAAVIGSAAVSSVVAGEPDVDEYEEYGFAFDQVINMVEDAGADPTGGEDISPLLVEYAEDGNLLYFPEGDYELSQFRNNEGDWSEFNSDQYYALDNFGIKGDGSDKTAFVWPEGTGYTDEHTSFDWSLLGFEIRYGVNQLFEGIRLDNTAPQTGARFQMYPDDGLLVLDVHADGRFDTHMTCFSFNIYDPEGYGLIENVRAPDGAINPWPDNAGSIGMYIPSWHEGTLTVRNCHIEGFQDNGLYASSADDPAAIQVEGRYFANSNISNVRLGQSRSYVKNATVVIDRRIDTEFTINMRGIRQQDGAGVTVKNCDVIHIADAPSSGAITNASRTGDLTIKNTRIHVGHPGSVNAISASSPSGGFENDGLTIKNVNITGNATTNEAIDITDRDDNVIQNVCIQETGEGRDGIALSRSSATLSNVRIEVEGEPIVEDDASTERHNVRYSADCVEPKPLRKDLPVFNGLVSHYDARSLDLGDEDTVAVWPDTWGNMDAVNPEVNDNDD